MRSITITERHRQAVMLVAEHGLLDTAQVSVLLGVSRPTAHRLLDALHTAGLLDRPFSGRGRQHRWDYTVTEVGVTVAVAGFHSQGRPVPRSVSAHAGRYFPYPERVRQHRINQEAYLRLLVPAALAANAELTAQGRALSREALADMLRRQGHAMSNARASALVKLVREHTAGGPPNKTPTEEVSDEPGGVRPGEPAIAGGLGGRGPP